MIRKATMIIIALTVVILGGYDVYALLEGGSEATISVVLWDGAQKYPMIPFLFGVLMGHFFWQNK